MQQLAGLQFSSPLKSPLQQQFLIISEMTAKLSSHKVSIIQDNQTKWTFPKRREKMLQKQLCYAVQCPVKLETDQENEPKGQNANKQTTTKTKATKERKEKRM